MKLHTNTLTLGIDIGSTTVKVALLNQASHIVFSDYERHYANIQETLAGLLKKAREITGPIQVIPVITGSGGLTLSSHLEVPFVQEVVAVASALQDFAPQTDVAIELGGEDAKIIYFTGGIDQRMNGICAGGTGSFIDQMAALLQTDASGLNDYAEHYKAIYPIAARCGVFAKSDIQPLINEGATREDLAASIFQAVVNQTISGLACGKPIRGNVAFLGGPLHFLPQLRESFIRTLRLTPEQVIAPDHSHLFAAVGAAMNPQDNQEPLPLETLIQRLIQLDKLDGNRKGVLRKITEEGQIVTNLITTFPATQIANPEIFPSLLFYYGMLTITAKRGNYLVLSIPNNNVRKQYYEFLLEEYQDKRHINLNDLGLMFYDMAYDGHWRESLEFIANAYKENSSVRSAIEGERNIQGFFTAYLSVNAYYLTAPEVELNHGYCDLFLMPDLLRYEVKHSYILELKYLSSKDTEEKAETQWKEAVEQIKKYAAAPKVRQLIHDTKLHCIVMQIRSYELKRMEEVHSL